MAPPTTELKKLSGKFRIGRVDDGKTTSAINSVKRLRKSHVCNQCRTSKLRCDKQKPCNSCIKRHEANLCSYSRTAELSKVSNTPMSAEARLLGLENLVTQLVQNQDKNKTAVQGQLRTVDQIPSPHPSPDSSTRLNTGEFVPGSGLQNTNYVGATHWSTVLDEIHELKRSIAGVHPEPSSQHTDQYQTTKKTQELIFGSLDGLSMEGIIANYLPSRLVTDRYLSIYFRGETVLVAYIHTYEFQRQYKRFLEDPLNANPLWVSMLFSVCYMASIFANIANTSKPSSTSSITIDHRLLEASGRCLVLGQYHKSQPFAVEALGLYAFCKNLISLDPCREAGTILSLVVRLAFEMGYHRDPDALGSFSPFEGEMRRRCWSSLKQIDLMMSFQLGLPSNICLENCDTRSPRNLLDSDFDVDTKELPPSRPENELTRLLWFVVKDKQIVGFSKVCRAALSFEEKSSSEVLQLDRAIREIYISIPEIMKTRPVSESLADSPFLIITRLYIEFIHLKSVCILHRKYMVRGYAQSTKACVEAGSSLVRQFIDMYTEFAPGGQLQDETWVLSNFTVNDFLLGVMVLCLFLSTSRKRDDLPSFEPVLSRNFILDLLQRALPICEEKSTSSKDARRVAQAINQTLRSHGNVLSSEVSGHNMTNDTGTASNVADSDQARQNMFDTQDIFMDLDLGLDDTNDAAFGWLDTFNLLSNDMNGIDWM